MIFKEMKSAASRAKSVAELIALAKENGIEFSWDEARGYFELINRMCELSDDKPDNVSVGGCYKKDGRMVVSGRYKCNEYQCLYCGIAYTAHHCKNNDWK